MANNKKNNVKKVKEEKYRSEEQQEIIRFAKILLVVIILIVGFYFATRLFVKKDLINDEKETAVTEIDYNKMVFGTMLNKTNDEYYVLAFSSVDNKANYYGALADKYESTENSLKVYYIDLEDSMNKTFVTEDGKTNPNAKEIEDLKVGDLTLIKISSGKIVKYVETVEDIKEEFNIE